MRRLEQDSRHLDRSASNLFKLRERLMTMELDLPFNISKKDADSALRRPS